jgi:hypothetical protein
LKHPGNGWKIGFFKRANPAQAIVSESPETARFFTMATRGLPSARANFGSSYALLRANSAAT